MVIFCAHGGRKVELRGVANEHGRLGKVSVELPAASFHEAETIALDAAFPFQVRSLSTWIFLYVWRKWT